MGKRLYVSTIGKASILTKFTVFFILMSILPILTLLEFYYQHLEHGQVTITRGQFEATFLFVILGVIVGYVAMRSIIVDLIKVTEANKKALENILSADKLKELTFEKNEISVLAESFSAITERLEENVKSLKIAKRTLHSVMEKVGEGITNMKNIDTFLELILETVTEAMGAQSGILLLRTERRSLKFEIKAQYDNGQIIRAEKAQFINIKEKTAFQSVLEIKKPMVFNDLTRPVSENKKINNLFKLPMVVAPMMSRERVNGIIVVSGHENSKSEFDEDDITLLFNLALQTAVAVENLRLNENIEKTYFETISALALAVDAKDQYSRGHLDRVANYCLKIGKTLGLDDDDLNTLRDGARLHDLGKIGIPDDILCKTGALDAQEMDLMRKHTEIGESIIKPVRSLNHLCDLIRHHHEKLNGKGYPDKLKGGEISPLVRILSVADVYDALTTDRSYRDRYDSKKAFEIMEEMGRELDQDIVLLLKEILSKE